MLAGQLRQTEQLCLHQPLALHICDACHAYLSGAGNLLAPFAGRSLLGLQDAGLISGYEVFKTLSGLLLNALLRGQRLTDAGIKARLLGGA